MDEVRLVLCGRAVTAHRLSEPDACKLRELYEDGGMLALLAGPETEAGHLLGFGALAGRNERVLAPKDFRGAPALEAYPAAAADVPDLAWLSERILKKRYAACAERSEEFFDTLMEEVLPPLRGEAVVLARERAPLGYLIYTAPKAEVTVTELVVDPACEEQVLGALADCFYYDETVTLKNFPASLETSDTRRETAFCGRILNLRALAACLTSPEPASLAFALTDELLPENSGRWRLVTGPAGGSLQALPADAPAERLSPSELLKRLLPAEKVFLPEDVRLTNR